MAVTTSIGPQYVQYSDTSGHLDNCIGGGEDYRTLNADTKNIYGAILAIHGWYGDNISDACKITNIKMSAKLRTRSTSNGWVGLKSDCDFEIMTVFGSEGISGNKIAGTIYGNTWKEFGKTISESSDWQLVSNECDVNAKANNSMPSIRLIFWNGNAISKVRCYVKNVAITATRTRACYITFKGDGITETTTMYDYNTVPSFGSTPTREGYIFKGWQSSAGGGIYSGTLPTAYEQDVTYTAVWAVNAPYTVNFNGNGATSGSIASLSKNAGESFSLPENTFEKKYAVVFNYNYSGASNSTETSSATFQGWEDHGSITAHTGETFDYTQFDAPFYANKYADLYNAFGYNKRSLANHYVDNGKSEGRECTGNPRGVYPSKATVVSIADDNSSTTLYAQWSAMPEITFPSPQRTGYVFLGWYTAPNGGTKVGDAGAKYTPTGNTTCYAHWEAIGLYIGSTAYDVYQGTTKLDIYQGTTKIQG